LPDRVRNAIVKIERSARRMPTPVRQIGLGLVGLVTRVLGSITSAESLQPVVALTFDDGPDPEVTPRILDMLKERGIKATFFILSERAEEHSELARRLVAEGHEAALHGSNHDNLTTLGMGQVMDRVRGGKQRLHRVVGSPVRLFRPPYGAQSLRTFALTRLSGMKVVVWSADPNDWDQVSLEEIVARTLQHVEPGAILLLHDGWTPDPDGDGNRPTGDKVEVVRQILDALEGAGLKCTTVSDLLSSSPARKRVWFETG
jgi:peptidoglycan/xylan/chitin deacetylase (PgdA/CDA1 family)